MKTVNEMKLSFPSKSCNEAFARSAVSAFILNLDPTVSELSDLKTAVSEAVTNCIVHGYRRQSGTIYISGRITDSRRVIIRVRDKGCGIADVGQAMQPLFTTAAAGFEDVHVTRLSWAFRGPTSARTRSVHPAYTVSSVLSSVTLVAGTRT